MAKDGASGDNQVPLGYSVGCAAPGCEFRTVISINPATAVRALRDHIQEAHPEYLEVFDKGTKENPGA